MIRNSIFDNRVIIMIVIAMIIFSREMWGPSDVPRTSHDHTSTNYCRHIPVLSRHSS